MKTFLLYQLLRIIFNPCIGTHRKRKLISCDEKQQKREVIKYYKVLDKSMIIYLIKFFKLCEIRNKIKMIEK